MTTTDAVLEESLQSERKVLGRGLQLIRRQLRRAPRQFTLGFAGTALYAVMTIASAFVIGYATDEVLIPSIAAGKVATASLVGAGLLIIGVSAARGLGIAIRRYGAYAAQYRLQQRDRTDVTDRYLELPIEWHRRYPTGQLLSNVNALEKLKVHDFRWVPADEFTKYPFPAADKHALDDFDVMVGNQRGKKPPQA